MISVHQLIHTEHIKYILCLTYDAIEEYAPKKERIKGVSIQGFIRTIINHHQNKQSESEDFWPLTTVGD